MAKGKTPSLIGSSLGRPEKKSCGKSTPCSRCQQNIPKGADCYDVQQPLKPHSATRRFCRTCFASVLEQTKCVLAELERLVAMELADQSP